MHILHLLLITLVLMFRPCTVFAQDHNDNKKLNQSLTAQGHDKSIGKETGLAIPRFVTLKTQHTNVRNGPSNRYPIKWLYLSKHYPLQVVGEFETWRKVKDIDGEEGWVHEVLLSGARYAIVVDNAHNTEAWSHIYKEGELVILRKAEESSYPVARVQLGAIVKLNKCTREWCNVLVSGYNGWLYKRNLWGVMQDEEFQ